MSTGALALALLAGVCGLVWLAVALLPARPWDLQPVGEDAPQPPEPAAWPAVTVLVPARDEALSLPRTLPSLLAQDYAGALRVVVIDDRSRDGTGDTATQVAAAHDRAARFALLRGVSLPPGWVGKMWALHQGLAAQALEHDAAPRYLLLTDADIAHAPRSLARLVAESETGGFVLNSRMALLRCVSPAERLLIPPYLYFFNLLYPMRRANDPGDRLGAAAGGCMLVRRDALEAAGGFAAIRGRIIDDIALARLLKGAGGATHLAVSRGEVRSLRVYDESPQGRPTPLWRGDVWRMVRRSAFTELRRSWPLLALCVALLALVYLTPPLLLAGGALALATGHHGAIAWTVLAAGALACALMVLTYLPTLRYFQLPAWRALTLPLAALLFACMTVDSALEHARGRGGRWR